MIRHEHVEVDDLPEFRVDAFPLDALPPTWRAMVSAGAEAQGVDAAFWAVPSLPILAGAVGATRRVRATRDWLEPCIVWAAVVAPSGSGKSPPLRALLAPMRERDKLLHAQTAAMQQARELQRATRGKGEPEPPPVPQLAAVVGDVTLEALASRLNDNPRGLLLAVDELAGWVRSFDRYRKGGDEQAWLSLHGGDALRVDRKTTGSYRVESPALSVCGTIQPSIAQQYLADRERRASGIAARVLVAGPPLTPARLADDGAGIPDDVRDGWAVLARSLLDLELEDGEPVAVALTADAREAFRDWHDANGDECYAAAQAGDDDAAAVLSKLRGYVPRVALLLALAKAAEVGTAALVRHVERQDVLDAVRIVDWFGAQARALYSRWDAMAAAERERRSGDDVERLAERLREIMADGLPRATRELHAALGRNQSGASLRAALESIGAIGERVPGARGGRPAELWRLPTEGDA